LVDAIIARFCSCCHSRTDAWDLNANTVLHLLTAYGQPNNGSANVKKRRLCTFIGVRQ
jgi:hypothetical protein